MKRFILAATMLMLAWAVANAQTARGPFVRAVGQATVAVKPDQAKIDFSVVTQATTAQAAAAQNSTLVANVLSQLMGLLGANADIQTLSYSLAPNYTYPQGQQPVLNGYTVSNTIQVTTMDLTIVGKVIDTGVGAGANQVTALRFGLKDDSAARAQALKLATAQAKSFADAMAAGVGQHTGAVLAVQEGVTAIAPVALTPGATTAQTPIQPGTVDIQATVTLDVALTS